MWLRPSRESRGRCGVLEEIERMRMRENPETWEDVRGRVEARLAVDRELD